MRLLHAVIAAAAAIVVTSAPANALAASSGPSVVDPNFNATATSAAGAYYGMEAWGGTTNTSSQYYTNNPSFVGSAPFGPSEQWNNGTPGNGVSKVGFISNNNAVPVGGGYIEQTIGGFTVGDTYTVTVLANNRIGMTQSALTISYSPVSLALTTRSLSAPPPSGSTTIYSAAVPSSNTTTTQTGAFTSVTSNTFIATSSSETIRLTNTGGADSTVLLSAFRLNDLGVVPVPEPVSMALLATGLLGLGLARRRR